MIVQGFHQIQKKKLEIDKDHRQSQDESMNKTNHKRSIWYNNNMNNDNISQTNNYDIELMIVEREN